MHLGIASGAMLLLPCVYPSRERFYQTFLPFKFSPLPHYIREEGRGRPGTEAKVNALLPPETPITE